MNFYLKCSECGIEYDIKPGVYLCPACSSLTKAGYPPRGVLETIAEGRVSSSPVSNPRDFIFEMLPVEREYFPPVPVGWTPLWEPARLWAETGIKNLYIKDDSLNPSGSLKDRASYLVAAFAVKYGISDIVVASTGNAASSMACIGASAGLDIRIYIPQSAPKAKMVQALQYGADVNLVAGSYDNAFDESIEYTTVNGGLNRNTAYNPLTIDGKKTAALEIFCQLGRVPDNILVPVGDGVILAGLYQGFLQLKSVGLTDSIPKIISVQAEGSSAINRAFNTGSFSDAVPSSTVADSIAVDIPRNGNLALKMLQDNGGAAVTVSDAAILSAQKKLASLCGLFAEPSSSSVLAGLSGAGSLVSEDDTTVLLVTGSGLKDIPSAMKGLGMEV